MNFGTIGQDLCKIANIPRLVPTLLEIIAYCFGSIVYGTAISRKPSRKGI